MITKKVSPFFSELGKLQNWIRGISDDLKQETDTGLGSNTNLYKIWYTRDAAILRLHNNLQKLENEIAFFFTEDGYRRAIEHFYNTPLLLEQFTAAVKFFSNEYFNIKLDHTGQKNCLKKDTSGSFAIT